MWFTRVHSACELRINKNRESFIQEMFVVSNNEESVEMALVSVECAANLS